MSNTGSNRPNADSLDQTEQARQENGDDEPKQGLIGYPKLARLMMQSPETAIFRRFKDLNMMNLLRLQAELHDMERQLQEIREEDAQSRDPFRSSYATDFRLMRDCKETGDSLQYELLLTIGEKIQEYSIESYTFHSDDLTY